MYLVYFDDGEEFIKQLQQHYFCNYKIEIIKEPLLTGTDIVKILGINPSKQIGIIKERLISAQLEGKVKTKEEAVEFIKTIKI